MIRSTIAKLNCFIKGHLFVAAEESFTIGEIFRFLIEEEILPNYVLTEDIANSIKELYARYLKKYGNSKVVNLVCTRCGRRENCIEEKRKEVREALEFLLRARPKILMM